MRKSTKGRKLYPFHCRICKAKLNNPGECQAHYQEKPDHRTSKNGKVVDINGHVVNTVYKKAWSLTDAVVKSKYSKAKSTRRWNYCPGCGMDLHGS